MSVPPVATTGPSDENSAACCPGHVWEESCSCDETEKHCKEHEENIEWSNESVADLGVTEWTVCEKHSTKKFNEDTHAPEEDTEERNNRHLFPL